MASGLVIAPLGALVAMSLRGDDDIWPHLIAYVLPPALQTTLVLLLGVCTLTGVIGVGTAWIVTTLRFPGRDLFTWLLPLPLAVPTYLVAYIYVELLEALGPVQRAFDAVVGLPTVAYWPSVRSVPGAVILFSLVLYPYVYLAARAMFQTQSASLIEVARTLGATRWRMARHVAIPLARPALAIGLALVALEALNDIGASEYLGVRTLSLSIFTTWLNRGSLPGAAQIACAMLVLIGFVLALERWGRRNRRFASSVQHSRTAPPLTVTGIHGLGCALACFVPVLFGFIVPVAFLARETLNRGLLGTLNTELLSAVQNTVVLSVVATAATLAIGFGTALAVRALRHRVADTLAAVAALGYAIPGTVLALGLLPPLVGFDRLLGGILALFGGQVGLLLTGSAAALVIAYLVRFLTVAIGSAQAGLARISPHVDDVARTLGARSREITWRIQIPLSRPALGGAALLIFVDCIKELPATLLLRPLNVETLATYIYQFASRGTFEEGALAALLIVAVGVLPAIRLVRYADLTVSPAPPRP